MVDLVECMERHTVSVIIPTTCQASRSNCLYRAIESIVNQSEVVVEVIIVLNGDQYDHKLVANLTEDDRVRLIRLEEANVSTARFVGVCNVTGDYFCFIDDDDEFLPDAFKLRLALFSSQDADIVVTNGYIYTEGNDIPVVKPGAAKEISANPVDSFLRRNWFGSAAAFFKTKSFDPEIFNFSFKYFEWTYLFFLLISKGNRFYFDETATYRKYEDNPSSVSKSIEYSMAYPAFLRTLNGLPLADDFKRIVQCKYITALNMQSNLEMRQGFLWRAWKSHLKCLLNGGWQYISYTRHLLRSTIWLKKV